MSEKAAVLTETAAALGSKFTIGGGFGSFGAFLLGFNWIGWIGIAIGLVGLATNIIFSYQKNKRERVEHQLRVQQLKGQSNENE